MNCVERPKTRLLFRAICLIVGCLLLLPALAACRRGETPPDDGTQGGTSTGGTPSGSETTGGGDTEEPGGDPNAVPQPIMEDFDGFEFRVLSRGSGNWTSDDIIGNITGTIVDQAVFNRNEKLMAQYNFVIKETKDANWTDTARVLGQAKEAAYEMWSFRMNDMPSLGQEGYLYNLNEVDGLNLDAVYYDQNNREMGSFNNYLFFLTGDMLYMDDMATQIITFNRDLFNQFLLEDVYGKDLYDLVRNHEWTLEVMQEFCRIATQDRNGDDVMRPEDDYYGFSYENANILGFNISCGNLLLEKDENDIFVLNVEQKMIDDLQRIMTFFNAGYSAGSTYQESRWLYGTQLFYPQWIKNLPASKSSGLNFGVVPMPLGSTDQQEYRGMITTYGSNCITICSTVDGEDLDKAANIIELLSYESMQSVTPKLEEYLLGGRVVNEAADSEMLEIALDGKSYELCYLWSTGSLYSTMIALNNADGIGIASALEGCKGAVEASVQRKLDRLNKLG